ncbi:MAG: dethiobiotin synthase [Alphaproteobacteria bacterium]
MSAWFVTGAGTAIGKTHISCALLDAWRNHGHACDAFKPLLSGYDPLEMEESDAGRLLIALDRPVTPETVAEMSPWRYRPALSPAAAAREAGTAVPYGDVVTACQSRIAARAGPLLIEGAGGVMSPLAEGKTNLDLIAALGLPVLLVVGSYLGSISHALTALEALRARRVRVAATIVSESAEAAESLADTIADLAQFHAGPIFAAPRFGEGATPPEVATLADVLRTS